MSGRHLLAIRVGDHLYRDSLNHLMDDEEFDALLDGRDLPPNILAYHYYGESQWAEVLKLPEYNPPTCRSVLVEVEIAFAPRGACRVCERVPADGLWQGKRWREYDQRVYPYRAYVCEQCAQQMEEDTASTGRWIA